jgi:hypothetical protein
MFKTLTYRCRCNKTFFPVTDAAAKKLECLFRKVFQDSILFVSMAGAYQIVDQTKKLLLE